MPPAVIGLISSVGLTLGAAWPAELSRRPLVGNQEVNLLFKKVPLRDYAKSAACRL